MALLALLGILRCVCDSTHELYYYIAVLIPLAAWEAQENRLPAATMMTYLIVTYLFAGLGRAPSYLLYFASTAGELLLVVYLARRAMTPGASPRTEPAVGSLRDVVSIAVARQSLPSLPAFAAPASEAEL